MRPPRIPDIRYAALVEERDRLIHEVEALKRGLNERCTFVEETISRSNDFRVHMESTVIALETLHEQLKTLEQTNEEELKRRETTIAELQEALKCTQLQLVESERHRKQLHNSLMDLKGNIRVFCRVRPLLTTGDGLGNESIISYPRTMESRDRGIELLADGRKNGFKFDRVFGPEASQLDIFVEISQLVQSALDGYKVCIFSYGHSGSGKTYTMLGEHESQERKGLIPRSLEQIFQTVLTLSAQGWEHTLKVSMLEIYNDEVHDLMSKRGSPRRVKHDATVAGLIELCVHSIDEVTRLLDIAARRRSVAETSKNSRSSRSHFICKLQISGMNKDTKEVVEGVLNLVDLAGSERDSEAVGERKKEAIMINLSLTWLGVLIRGVADKQEHVMFKDSKLTRLLQPYLGGDSKTLMFVNVSSEPSSATESLRSLNFAARVNEGRIGDSRAQTSKRVRDSHSRHGRPTPSPLGYGRQTTMR